MKVFLKGKVKLPQDQFGTPTWPPFYFRHQHDCLFHFRSREIISYERIAVYGKIVVYCEINETILGPCRGGIWTLVMKIKGSEVRSVKQIPQLKSHTLPPQGILVPRACRFPLSNGVRQLRPQKCKCFKDFTCP